MNEFMDGFVEEIEKDAISPKHLPLLAAAGGLGVVGASGTAGYRSEKSGKHGALGGWARRHPIISGMIPYAGGGYHFGRLSAQAAKGAGRKKVVKNSNRSGN